MKPRTVVLLNNLLLPPFPIPARDLFQMPLHLVPHLRRIILCFALAFLPFWSVAAPVPGPAATPLRTNGYRFLDLSAYAVPQGSEVSKQFGIIREGLQGFDGVPFKVGEKVALTGLESASRHGDFYPTEISAITTGVPFTRLHLLHSALNFAKDGVPIAAIKFKYAGGTEEIVRIGYGIHLRTWTRSGMEKKSSLADPNSHLISVGADPGDPGAGFRVYHTAIENPRPQEQVASLEIQSLFSRATPVILAVSLEDAQSGLPPNVPVVARKALKDLKNAPANRGSLQVRVTDGAGGPPITNVLAILTIRDDAAGFYFGETRSDAQGVCRLPFPPSETVGFNLLVRAPNRIPQLISQSRTNQPALKTDFSVALERGTAIGGLVKGPDGKPVAGAQIDIHKVVKLGAREYTRTDYDTAVTGPDGKWSSSSVPQDFQGFSFQVAHPEFRPTLYSMAGFADPPVASSTVSSSSRSAPLYRQGPDGAMVAVSPGDNLRSRPAPRNSSIRLLTREALLSSQAEMTLESAIIVSGIVMDSSGKPLPGADLVFQRRTPSFERKYVKTDDAGRFRIPTSEPGDAAVIVIRDGHTPKYHLLNIVPGMASVEIRLAPARVMRGRVTDRQQVPVSAARVKLEEWVGFTDVLQFETLTDPNGRFAWTGAPSDQITFYINKTNYYGMRHSVSGYPEAGEMDFVLNRPNGIYGKVYDADTKKPIENFTVIPGRKYSQTEQRIRWERYESTRGADGEYSIRMEQYYFQPEARIKVEAFGYLPQVSAGFTSQGSYTNDFALIRAKGIEGLVQAADGTPLGNATVMLVEKDEYAYMDSPGSFRQSSSGGDFTRTDSKGHFEFSPKLEPDAILVTHEKGFAEVMIRQLPKDGKITVEPWSAVKGVVKVGDSNAPNQFVRVQNYFLQSVDVSGQRSTALSLYMKTEPDEAGNFSYEKVPSGYRTLYLEYKLKDSNNGETPLSHGKVVELKPGVTNEVVFGGDGRRVMGQVKLIGGEQSDVDWKRDVHRLTLIQDLPQVLPNGQAHPNALEGNYVLLFETNGAFHADNVPPGKYTLSISPNDPEEEYYRNRPLGSLRQEVTVPNDPSAKLNQPFDLGSVELKIATKAKMGKKVPPIELKSFAGKPIKLEDFLGKHVLIYFYASTSYSTYDFQVLKDLNNTFGADGKLVILGMNLDSTLAAAEQFVQRNQMTWPQAYLGEWSQTQVPPLFGVDGYPVGVLVDKEGKLIGRQLRSSRLRDAVRNAVSGNAEVSILRE
ncbi:MAG: hypothetical protein JWM16_1022 [Verrucomicrobiales bacterium]|nr:hypothetical protein [Verrucomicrobiales bacterium]